MEITYLGHSSFRIKGKSVTIITDPFDPKKVGLKYPKVSADIVTLSHQHDDHNAVENVTDVKKIIDGPGEYEIAEVSIVGIDSFHDDKKGELRGRNTIYVIEIDQLTIVHLGDLGHKLTDEQLKEIGDTDIALIPVGGEYTIDAKTAVEVMHSVGPSIAIPMHFQAPGLNPETFSKLTGVDEFLSEANLKVEKLPKLSIKEADLKDEELKIVVLEKK